MEHKVSHLTQVVQYCRKSFYSVFVFSFITNALILTVPIYMLQIFDRVLSSGSVDTLVFLTIIAIIALLIMALLNATRERILAAVGRWFDNQLGAVSLSRSADALLQGDMYGKQSLRDIATIRNFMTGQTFLSIFDAPWSPIFIFVIFLLNVWLGLIALVGGILLFVLAYLNEIYTRALLAKADDAAVKTQQQVDSMMKNVEVIQSMGMMPEIIRRWFYKNEETLALQDIAAKYARKIMASAKFLRVTLQLLILGTGAFFVIQGKMTPGSMIVCSILMARALAPIEQSMSTWRMFIKARHAYKKLFHYLSAPEHRGENPTSLPQPQGHVKVENLTYVPPKMKKPILSNIAFDLQAGEVLVVIGPSGAGKSTLARLILGILKPSFGTARIDNAMTYYWERSDFGKHIGYLPQYVDLFDGTVTDNISRMQPDSDEEAVKAAKMVGAHDMILQFNNGYDTDITGFNLSGGQRQRVALARAFFGNPRVIVLDEPGSSLDEKGNEALAEAIENGKKEGITVILITHQQNLVSLADKALVLIEGKMEVYGPKEKVFEYLKTKATPVKRESNEQQADNV